MERVRQENESSPVLEDEAEASKQRHRPQRRGCCSEKRGLGTAMTPDPDPAYTEGHINAVVSAGQDRDDLWRHEVPIQLPRDLRVLRDSSSSPSSPPGFCTSPPQPKPLDGLSLPRPRLKLPP
ncbi:hypothetical protein D9C73_010612 [Collichthys lucidus]|uniref:Uncharacterized protein n=1 Tax=Collichthys lucidus TaxID=240159 RepID=A0A4U5UNH4_COLLU|nr:hypothetical protein D9C73_010612 [Collichthys lucidus]